MANNIMNKTTNQPKMKFREFMQIPTVVNNISSTLGDSAKSKKFVAALTSAVNTNLALQECDFGTIVNAALLGEALNLSPSASLGQYYIVPYNDNKNNRKVGTFQLGYKGYLQLAMRTGEYKRINVLPIKEGELIKYSRLDETIEIKEIEDDDVRESAKTIGYYAMFETINGFRKSIYWSKKKILNHADKYSMAFSKDGGNGKVSFEDYENNKYDKKDERKYSSFWYKNFDEMACKTMLRQLISKWGYMSVDMQRAFEADMSEVKEVNKDGVDEYNYIDNQPYYEEDEGHADVRAFMEQEAQRTKQDTGEIIDNEYEGGFNFEE